MKKCLIYPEREKNGGISLQEYYTKRHGFEITTNANIDWAFGLYVNFNEKSVNRLQDSKKLIVNRNIKDVTKSNVEYIFKQVYGYGSFADLTKYGMAVRKSEKQCAKDFKVVETPCKKDDNFVYQRFLNSRIAIDWVRDFRFYFAFDKFVLLRRDKHIEGTFYGGNARQTFTSVDYKKYFCTEDIDRIILVKNIIGMDVGAIDVVRDYSDGLVYVLDINNISGIPQFIVDKIDKDYSKIFIEELNKRL